MSTQGQAPFEKMVFRKTNTQLGRHIFVSPANSTMRHLGYGRIILNASVPQVAFSTGGHETALVCLSGGAEVGRAAGTLDGKQARIRVDEINRIGKRLKSRAVGTAVPNHLWRCH